MPMKMKMKEVSMKHEELKCYKVNEYIEQKQKQVDIYVAQK